MGPIAKAVTEQTHLYEGGGDWWGNAIQDRTLTTAVARNRITTGESSNLTGDFRSAMKMEDLTAYSAERTPYERRRLVQVDAFNNDKAGE